MERVSLIREAIDAEALQRAVAGHSAGAIALFLGTVRADSADGKTLVALDYEAYDAMALSQMTAVRVRAIAEKGILDAAIVHRLGRIPLGEASIAVAVASAHRAEAFNACRWIVDQVKLDVPIWKKDIWSDGTTEWVDPTT